jgi:hypothetical protein
MTALVSRPRICDDLVPVILALNDEQWWPCDLRNLALVSRSAWLQPVRKRLYACPVVHTFRGCDLLARTLRENPSLVDLLQGIDLRPLGDGAGSSTEMASLRFLLAVQHARKVVLAGELAFKAERFLQALTTPYVVTELQIDGHMLGWKHEACCHRYASLRWDASVALAFPHLRKLRLCKVEVDIHPSSVALPTSLAEVDLDQVHFTGSLQHFADFTAVKTLRIACECGGSFAPHMAMILASCAQNLETLEYEVQHGWHEDDSLLRSAEHYPRLQELSLHGVPLGLGDLHRVAERGPATRTLTVTGRWSPMSSGEWAAFLESGALPHLRHLRTPGGTFSRPWNRWSEDMKEEVRQACLTRGIHLD